VNLLLQLPIYLKRFKFFLGKKLYLSFLITFLAGLSESFGILMVLPLLDSIQSGNEKIVSSNESYQFLLDYFNTFESITPVTGILIFIAIAFVLKGALTFWAFSFNARLRGELLEILKKRLFDSYSTMTYEYYLKKDVGYFINIINEQTGKVVEALRNITQLVSHLIYSCIYLFVAIMLAWEFGIMALVVAISVQIFFNKINNKVREISYDNTYENSVISSLLIQSLYAFKYLISTGQIDKQGTHVNSSIERLKKHYVKFGVLASLTQSLREPIVVIFIMVIVIFQLVFLEQPLAPIIVSIMLFYRALNASVSIQGNFQNLIEFSGSIDIVNLELNNLHKNFEEKGSKNFERFSRRIEFFNVGFSYKGDNKNLNNINMVIPYKKSIAIIGHSGSGKSTIADMITLVNSPKEGLINIDGIDSREINKRKWRENIGYVSQEAVIFDGSIEFNITLSDDRSSYSAGDLNKAIKKANLNEFIRSLEDGYKTMVGDRGIKLSGGQRQRLFIAREIFRNPSLLILDEATSALDSESELAVQDSINGLKKQMSIVIIAHRLSTINKADFVYVLDNGEIVESGTYEELKTIENSQLNTFLNLQSR